MNPIYKNIPKNIRLLFDGNSLTNQGANGLVGDQRYPIACYNSVAALNKRISYFNFGIGSRRTQALTDEFATKVVPSTRPGDIVIFWEITNEAHDFTTDTNGDLLFAHVQAYCAQARTYGLKIVVLTGIARLMVGFDDANITDRIMACNVQLRNNPSTYDLLIDVAALSQFDNVLDTTDLTYYNADGTHLTNVGYDLIATTAYNSLNSSGLLNVV